MHATTRALIEEFHPLVGYTQSDEITLAWHLPSDSRSQYPFDGKLQKLCSVLAGFASATFARAALTLLPEKQEQVPHFDARAWQVPTLTEEERGRIPEAFRPAIGEVFLRSSVEALEIGPIRRETEAMAMLFGTTP